MSDDLPWHKDEWGSGSYLYQNRHGAVGYVDGPGSNPGLVRVIKVFGSDAPLIRDLIAAVIAQLSATPEFRVGRRVPRNVYRGDEPVFMAATEEEAAELVALLNAGLGLIALAQKDDPHGR